MGPCVSRIVLVLTFLGHDLYALYSLPMSGLGISGYLLSCAFIQYHWNLSKGYVTCS